MGIKRVMISVLAGMIMSVSLVSPASAANGNYRQFKGYETYSAEINDGCLADYVQSYKGWHHKRVSKAKRAKGWTSLPVDGRSGWHLWLNQYSGECQNEYPECESEDSQNCWWNATKQGNGKGKSFLDINGRAYYVDNRLL